MRGSPGTPGFVGVRLKEAREARSLTMVALADLLGVTKQAVSQYEKDLQSPSPEVMDRICTVLNLPAHFFCRDVVRREIGSLFFRSFSTATKTARMRAFRRFQWLEEIVQHFQSYVQFPEARFPKFDLPDDPALIRPDVIEELAMHARRFWNLKDGPISNIVWLIENNGGIVVRQVLDSEDLDAFSNWNQESSRPIIVLSSDKFASARSRFDAAHELGHMLLHRAVTPTMMQKREIFSLVENQAMRFASAFLMPAVSFSAELRVCSIEAMRVLKSKWKVSIGAMIKRAADLRLISEHEERRLWISIARRGWRLREPLDDVLELETPRFMQGCMDLVFQSGIASRDGFANQLSLSESDIEGLLGLPLGYLRQTDDRSPLVLKMPESTASLPGESRPFDENPSVKFRPRAGQK